MFMFTMIVCTVNSSHKLLSFVFAAQCFFFASNKSTSKPENVLKATSGVFVIPSKDFHTFLVPLEVFMLSETSSIGHRFAFVYFEFDGVLCHFVLPFNQTGQPRWQIIVLFCFCIKKKFFQTLRVEKSLSKLNKARSC